MNAVLSRLLQTAAALLLMSLAAFFLMGLMPGDPVDLMAAANPQATPEDIARLRAVHGLDRPLHERYARWLAAALTGDLGHSRLYGLPVTEVLPPRLWNTFLLLGAALALTVGLGVPLGVFAARRADGFSAHAVDVLALAGMSLPPFWTALLLIVVFAAGAGWLPAGADPGNPVSMILPVAALTLGGLASYFRHMRAAMQEALRAPWIVTARAKGCTERRVTWNHAFRCACPPVATLFALDLGALCGGAVTVETVFSWPGMGRLMYDAVMGNDYNLALTGFLLLTALVLLAGALADAAVRLLDPRSGDAT